MEQHKKLSHDTFTEASHAFFRQGNAIGCLVLHGFTGTPANVRSLTEALSNEGYTVYAPLLSGHAATIEEMRSVSGKTWLEDAKTAYQKLVDAECGDIFVLGMSMGGILASLLTREVRLKGIVLLCVPFKMRRKLIAVSKIWPILPYIRRARKEGQRPKDAEGYSGFPTRSLHELERLTKQAREGLEKIACPALIIQSRLDTRVDLKSVEAAAKRINGGKTDFLWLEHSRHGCTYGPEKELAAKACVEFIRRTLAKQAQQG